MQIPWESLDPETLERMLTEIVTRDGTDYGFHETATAAKVATALKSLQRGKSQLFWDSESETSALIPTEQVLKEENRIADERRKSGIED